MGNPENEGKIEQLMEVIDKDEDIEIELPENVDNQRNKDGEIYSYKQNNGFSELEKDQEVFHQIFQREGNCKNAFSKLEKDQRRFY